MSLDTDDLKIIPTIGMTPYRARITEVGNDRVRQRFAARRDHEREAILKADADVALEAARIQAEREAAWKLDAAIVARARDGRNWHPATLIIRAVASAHGFTVAELKSTARNNKVVIARHEAMWRMKQETKLSLPEIGRRLGGRDHTTILWGVRQHTRRLAAVGGGAS